MVRGIMLDARMCSHSSQEVTRMTSMLSVSIFKTDAKSIPEKKLQIGQLRLDVLGNKVGDLSINQPVKLAFQGRVAH